MIGGRKDPVETLAGAVLALDFRTENAELYQMKAALADAQSKRDATREEIRTLSERILNFSGPDPAKVAEAILSGQSPAEAAAAGASRADLEDRRDSLVASLEPMRARIDQLAAEVEAHKAAMRERIADAAEPFLEHLRSRQVAAAEELLATEAAMIALGRVTGRHLDADGRAQRARAGVTGGSSLLGWRDALVVPAEVLAALKPLVDGCGAVPGLPTAIPLR